MTLDEVLRRWSMDDLAAALDTLDFLFDLDVDAQQASSHAAESEP